jgi:PAS domain S-box-containing protein
MGLGVLRALLQAKVAVVALVAALCLCGPASAEGETTFTPPRSLTVTLHEDYAPYSFLPEGGEVQGIMRDLWDLWSRRTGVDVHYKPVARADRLKLVDDGEADVAGNVMSTDARSDEYLLSPAPMVDIEIVLFFDRGISGIAGVESLQGFTIGVMGNGNCAEWLRANGLNRLRDYGNWESLFGAAARREIDVFCSGKAAGLRRLYLKNLETQFKVSPPLFKTPFVWAVRKEDVALRDFIARGFAMIRPEERAAIEERWIGRPVESAWDNPALRFLAWMLLAAAIGAALLFIWNASLRRQVALKTVGLAVSERRYRELVEALPVGIFETDAAGGNTYANGVWVELTGLSRTQTLGDGWIAAIHPEDRAGLQARWRAAIAAKRPFKSEHRLCRLDGSIVWVTVDAVPRFDSAGTFIGMIGSISDVTERRRIEEERLRLEAQSQESKKLEALGQFAGGIAHDFNNFLGAILGYAQFIVEDAATESGADHPAARYAQRIVTAGRRGRALVEQILTFTRRTRMTRRRFHLSELLGEIEELMFASALGAVEFRCENADPDAVVEADRDQLGQVLLNLCINAQDALRGRPGGVMVRIRRTVLADEAVARLTAGIRGENVPADIRVWTDAGGTAWAVAGSLDPALPHVSLVVSDTGFGMDQALLEQAFTPFFTTKEKGHGTGLGLAVVRGIVLAHGAALIAQSRAGEGTSIEVVLPRIAITIPRGEPAAPAPARVRRRVLLVDDDADFCDMMHLMLERLGFESVPYVRAREALADFRELPETWDALITDQNMPEMSGLELLSAVKAIRPELPCLICSAFSENLTDAALREAGALALIRKPVDKDLLLATLERALGASQDRHARA